MTDYDRSQTLVSRLRKAFVATLGSVRQYAINTDKASVEEFRSRLAAITSEVEQGIDDGENGPLDHATASIRGLLRDYRDRSEHYIQHLRTSLASTTDVLRETIAALRADDSDAERQLKTEIIHLSSLDKLHDIDEVQKCVRHTVAALTSCVDQLRREKNVVIAQLRDEIRTLQRSIEEVHRAASVDTVTGTYQRTEFEKAVQREILRGKSVCVIRLWLQNLQSFGPRIPLDQILAAFSKRAQEVVTAESIGRWQDDVFCVLVPAASSQQAATALENKCNGIYSYMDGESVRTLYLQLVVTCLPCSPDSDVDEFLTNLDVAVSTI